MPIISYTDNPLLNFFQTILHNQVLMTAILGWVVAVIAKAFVSIIVHRSLQLEDFLGTGGMPSTHTSPVAALALITGLVEGFDSSIFAITVALLTIVMYDASGIRRAAGGHAKAINILYKSLLEFEQIKPAQLIELRELLGHEPIEVAGGAAIGFLTAFYIWTGGFFAPGYLNQLIS